jgi:ribosome maturation factor RimP
MNTDLRKLIAICLVFFLFHFSFLQAATPPDPASLKEKVDLFGVGAKVKLRLADGEKLRGSIETITDETFSFNPGPGTLQRQIAYDQVVDLELAKRVYRTQDQPDPVEARRVVVALGVGKHVVVKTTTGKEFHGHIQAIEPDNFTLLPDRAVAPVQIAYGEVRHVEKNLSAGATLVLVILIVAVVAVVSTVIAKN